jgi:hypothetical protein
MKYYREPCGDFTAVADRIDGTPFFAGRATIVEGRIDTVHTVSIHQDIINTWQPVNIADIPVQWLTALLAS